MTKSLKGLMIAAALALASVAHAQGGTIGGGGSCCSAATINPKDSIHFTGTSSVILGGNGTPFTLQAGTGNSRRFFFSTTNSGGAPVTPAILNSTQWLMSGAGSATVPSYSFQGDTIKGFYSSNSNEIGVATFGQLSLTISGGSAVNLSGGAGSMILTSGTGNSRTLTIRTTTSAGTVKNVLVLGADSSVTFLGQPIMPGLPAEGSTKNALCWDGATFAVTQNAAATCTVSARRFKENIVTLNDSVALAEILALRPVTYREKNGHIQHIGLVAEEANAVDHRLATFDNTGQITSVNYEQVTVLLLSAVQQQQHDIDLLRTALLGIVGAAGAAGIGLAAKKKAAATAVAA